MKRIFAAVLFVVMMASLCSLTVFALDEGENNNNKANATPISVGEDVTGNLSSSQDQDWFKVQIPADGYVTIDLEHELLNSGSYYWQIHLYQADGVTGIVGYDYKWLVQGNQQGRTSQVGLKAGIYYVKICYNPYNHSDTTYTLRVNFTETSGTELEPNGDKNHANDIALNTPYIGNLTSDKDVDWFRVEIPADGYVSLDFQHELLNYGSYCWQMYLYQADGVNGAMGYDCKWLVQGNQQGRTSQVGLKAGTYYVKICYNPYNHSDTTYTLRVNFTESSNTELESNGDKASATVIQPNGNYFGSIASDRDEDWYQVTLSSEAEVTLNFTHELLDNGSQFWLVYLYQADGVSEVGKFKVNGKENGAFQIGKLAAGTYYIRVTYCPYNHSDLTYTLNLTEKHDCAGGWVNVKDPTCTAEGSRQQICSVCGKVLATEAVPALGHGTANWNVTKEPTCSDTGYRTGTCDRCQESLSEVVPTLPHTYGSWQQISGSKVIPPIVRQQTCTTCNYVNTVNDWSYIWVTILVLLGIAGVIFGIVNYVKAFKSQRY